MEREEAKKNGTTDMLPKLHGIPISIKDIVRYTPKYSYLITLSCLQINQKGFRTTVGCQYLGKEVHTEDAVTVTLLRKAGAIPIVRGNVPQLALTMHTDNFLWGRAQNPYDVTRSCGGSSGGEGGIVASRCAPLAFGSDVAGSIRIPAAFNGVRGFKPTPARCSAEG